MFSREFKNQPDTIGSEYILENFFSDFIAFSRDYDPVKNPNISIGDALDFSSEDTYDRDFDFIDAIEYLKKVISIGL